MFQDRFYLKPYEKEYDATVKDVIQDGEIYKVVLDDTIFYPEGGGQNADKGTINSFEVLDVQTKDGVIYHYLKEELKKGDKVHLVLDFENRYQNMKSHTGEHIVSGLVCSTLGANNVGFHMGKEFVTMDFDKFISEDVLRDIEKRANEAISKNIKVKETVLSPEEAKKITYRSKKELNEDIRLVEIEGVDRCACCGIHVDTTGEIGFIKLLYSEKYKSGSRVFMLASKKALDEFNKEYSILQELSEMLSSEFDNIVSQVKSLKDANVALEKQIKEIKLESFREEVEGLEERDIRVIIKKNLTGYDLKNMIEVLAEKSTAIAIILSKEESETKYIIKSKVKDDIKANEVARLLNDRFTGKGGGTPELAQGKLEEVNEENIIKFLETKI